MSFGGALLLNVLERSSMLHGALPRALVPTLTDFFFFFFGHSFLLSFYSLPQKFFFFLNKKHGLIGFGLG